MTDRFWPAAFGGATGSAITQAVTGNCNPLQVIGIGFGVAIFMSIVRAALGDRLPRRASKGET